MTRMTRMTRMTPMTPFNPFKPLTLYAFKPLDARVGLGWVSLEENKIEKPKPALEGLR